MYIICYVMYRPIHHVKVPFAEQSFSQPGVRMSNICRFCRRFLSFGPPSPTLQLYKMLSRIS